MSAKGEKMTLGQFKKAIQDKSISDDQILQLFFSIKIKNAEDVVEAMFLLAYRPTVLEKVRRQIHKALGY